jgi:glyoxalase family protein
MGGYAWGLLLSTLFLLVVTCPMSDDALQGIHHVSAVTGQAEANVRFYTQVLGLRLVTKTVNQDDPSSYHLFYGDETGSPGTDLTFFDVPQARAQRPGTGLITGTSLRVRGREALRRWADRLDAHDVRRTPLHRRAGRAALTLFDDEGQTIHLVDDADDAARVPDTTPWGDGPVPVDWAIRGLGPVEVTVADLGPTRRVLTEVFGFREGRAYEVEADAAELDESIPTPSPSATVFETGPGGVATELHVIERPDADRGWLGRGGVHHLALRTPNGDTIRRWQERITNAGLNPSPVIDRHYFESVYTREPGGILIEIATDTGTPFPVEEAAAGTVTLPPALEAQRDEIEAQLTPIGTGQ